MPSQLMRNLGPWRTVEALKTRHQYVVAEGIAGYTMSNHAKFLGPDYFLSATMRRRSSGSGPSPVRMPATGDLRGEKRRPRVDRRVLGSSCERRLLACAVTRRRFSSGCRAHPATAPAGSNRSSHGGNEMAEAFD